MKITTQFPPEGTCQCVRKTHACRFIVVTGGPGAGKTAILELAARHFCRHVLVLPEAASILYNGGFLRHDSRPAREAAQRAIFHVQREQERIGLEEKKYSVVICDRGTLDGLAYWPGSESSFFEEIGSSKAHELKRYQKVIHLHTPSTEFGYNHRNPARIESVAAAQDLDRKIFRSWKGHPNLVNIQSTHDFFEKVMLTIQAIQEEVPECCKAHLEERHMEYVQNP